MRSTPDHLDVKASATEVFPPPRAELAPPRGDVRVAAASFWLDRLFQVAEHAPGILRLIRVPFARVGFRCSSAIRAGTLANARVILGQGSTPAQHAALGRRVVENFILFCHDIGQSMRMSVEELHGQVEAVEGHEHYAAARRLKRGAIVVTAHMGSFEVGMAALRQQDARIHVVFRRDAFGRFERMRTALRSKLAVSEAPVDDGWTVWIRLRDALLKDEVVVLQADRVMPGQKGERVPVLGADMLLPAGPVKLALATGAPIVPVFAIRTPGGKIRLCVEPAIFATTEQGIEPAMKQLADVIGTYVKNHADQWLMLQPAWCEGTPT